MRTFAQHVRLTEASAEKSMQFMTPFLKRVWDDDLASDLIEADGDGQLQIFLTQKGVWNKYIDGYGSADESLWPYLFEYLFNYIQNYIDPTKGKYTVWIVRQWAQGGIRRWEDLESRVSEALSAFHQAKSSGFFKRQQNSHLAKFADINAFESLTALEGFIRLLGLKDQSIKESAFEKHLNAGSFGLIYGDETEFVIVMDNHDGLEASVDLFRGPTAWCTARPGNSYFEDYMMRGPLYALKTKEGEYAQFHFESGQYLDQTDSKIDPMMYNRLKFLIEKLVAHINEIGNSGEHAYQAIVNEMVLSYWAEDISTDLTEQEIFKIAVEAAVSLSTNLTEDWMRSAVMGWGGPLEEYFSREATNLSLLLSQYGPLPTPILKWFFERTESPQYALSSCAADLFDEQFIEFYDYYVERGLLTMPVFSTSGYINSPLGIMWDRRYKLLNKGLQGS